MPRYKGSARSLRRAPQCVARIPARDGGTPCVRTHPAPLSGALAALLIAGLACPADAGTVLPSPIFSGPKRSLVAERPRVEAPQEQAEAELETPLEVTPVQAVPVEMAAPEVVVQEAASAGGVAEAPQPQPDAMEAVAPDAASSDSVVAASEVAAPEVAVESPDASAEDAGAEMMTEVLFVITPARVERTQKRESLPYLPHVGPPPLRLESAPKADRTRLVGLAAFNAMMEARRAALAENAQQEAPDAQAPQPVAQRPADVPQQTAAAEAPQQPARPATTTTTTISQSSVAVLSSGQDAAFDPALILPYFETRNGPQGRGTGVQFVLPHQQPQAPLVMQSRATYGQSEAPGPSGAVQNGGGN